MKTSPLFAVILTTILVLPACEPSQQTTAPVLPNATLARASSCDVSGGGIDTNVEVVPATKAGRAVFHIEPVSTMCDQDPNGIWFKVFAFVDDGSDAGRRILLGSDHSPAALRQRTDSAGITSTSWALDVDFVPTALPLATTNGFSHRVIVEADGPGGKIGEIECFTVESPDAGPRGPHLHGKD